jgi:hypothetical protein
LPATEVEKDVRRWLDEEDTKRGVAAQEAVREELVPSPDVVPGFERAHYKLSQTAVIAAVGCIRRGHRPGAAEPLSGRGLASGIHACLEAVRPRLPSKPHGIRRGILLAFEEQRIYGSDSTPSETTHAFLESRGDSESSHPE